jgi:hypothetical protein
LVKMVWKEVRDASQEGLVKKEKFLRDVAPLLENVTVGHFFYRVFHNCSSYSFLSLSGNEFLCVSHKLITF